MTFKICDQAKLPATKHPCTGTTNANRLAAVTSSSRTLPPLLYVLTARAMLSAALCWKRTEQGQVMACPPGFNKVKKSRGAEKRDQSLVLPASLSQWLERVLAFLEASEADWRLLLLHIGLNDHFGAYFAKTFQCSATIPSSSQF